MKIIELWRKLYHDLFNCIHTNILTVDTQNFSEDMVVRAE